MAKFDLAKKLRKKIKTIRETNEINLNSSDIKIKQIATALYFIDKFALRVGNEKGEDESDTVGVTSLRREHVELLDDLEIKLDFLGKDSVRYVNTVKIDPLVYKNIAEFMTNKEDSANLFDKIIPNDVNKYLQNFMKGLTAKVFRTFNASLLFERELNKISKKIDEYDGDDKINLLLDGFNKANAKVAILCNHQKNISKSFEDQVKSINSQIKEIKKKIEEIKSKSENKTDQIKKLKDRLKKLKAKKSLKIETKNISLGTSKVNYIDPRITFAFIQKHNIPVEKIFSKTLIDKFKWAMNSDNKISNDDSQNTDIDLE
jgi:DNA topoisomerase-1